MPLSQQEKDALDGKTNVGKVEVMAYLLGMPEDAEILINLGKAHVRSSYPEYDPEELSNNHLALAILRQSYIYHREIYRAYDGAIEAAREALRAAQRAAGEAIEPDRDIGELPPIEPEPDPAEDETNA